MSNAVVGGIYAQIIDNLVKDSQEDFEAAGLDQSTLQDLKTTWQENISRLGVATLPWDPAQAPQNLSNPPTVPSNAKVDSQQPQFKAESSGNSTPVSRPAQSNPAIKQEPQEGINYEAQNLPPQAPYSDGMTVAKQRAHQLLAQQYGQQANASIQASSQRPVQLPGGQQRPTHIQLPGPPRSNQSQYPAHQQSDVSSAQTDGAADDAMSIWRTTLAERRAVGSEDREAADRQLRQYVEASSDFLESGLLVPSAQMHRAHRNGKAKTLLPVTLAQSSSSGIPQLDGEYDADDKSAIKKELEDTDEDAINSDLDDPDDGLDDDGDDDDEGGPMGETILCTYDKVQRVKNKWKCTLKDGILTTGKKEYVFHKATGEFEW